MDGERRARRSRIGAVRKDDIEPYTALRWVATLFKGAAVFLGVAVIAEFIAGLRAEGWAVVPTLLGEIARTAVLAIVLWGGGDLVRLLIHIGHDIRANRILLARLLQRPGIVEHPRAREVRGFEPLPGGPQRPPAVGGEAAAG